MRNVSDPIIVSASFPPESLLGENLFDGRPEIELEFERTVPFGEQYRSLLWVRGSDAHVAESRLDDCDPVECIDSLEDNNGERLFEVAWDDEQGALARIIADSDVQALSMRGTPESWDGHFWARTRETLIEFNESLMLAGVPITLKRISNSPYQERHSLSEKQREAVRLAYQRGYFEVPRKCTKQELADELSISDSAFSQRLRRAVAACVEETVDGSTLLRQL
jgi:Predicted DNA binding protein